MEAMRLVQINAEHITRELIVKIHGWCNLDCSYCYVYNSVDQSWRLKSKKMSRETMQHLAKRVAEYLREHRLPSMRIVLHGGEPLLSGIEDIEYLVTTFREALPSNRTLTFVMQSNGTLLTESILERFLELDIKIGISLDGDKEANRHRPMRSGKSSYEAVHRALKLFENERYRSLLSGLLAVVHLDNDPVATYDHLSQYGVPIDTLWPLGNWVQPPVGSSPLTGQPNYGEWTAKIFDHAYTRGGRPPVQVRLIDQLLRLLKAAVTGKPFPAEHGIELVGPWVVGAIVAEVDGTFELLDGYKTVGEGEAATGLNVREHTLTQALVASLEASVQRELVGPCQECQECTLLRVCGGGYFLDRYGPDGTYKHRSVYCDDLKYLINHLYKWLVREVEKNKARPVTQV